MSLYLLSNDMKLRTAINRQLKKPCPAATTFNRITTLKQAMETDRHAVLLIDDEFSKKGLLYLIHTIMKEHLPGKKILISSASHLDAQAGYVKDNSFGILHRCSKIEQLISCVIEVAGIRAISDHLTKPQKDRLMKTQGNNRLSSVLIGQSANITNIHNIIQTIGPNFTGVHIEGETGTGKEVIANLLREESETPDPFIVVNCSTIPETLADTHLFGSRRGAYTDAKESTPGYVGQANGGVLFLDELEDMGKPVQAKLLRLLETHSYQRVGGDSIQQSRFKLITASNIPLRTLRDTDKIRSDLFYRLERLVIHIAPLRERKEDIPLLVDHFLSLLGEYRRPDRTTMRLIMDYNWPGNARELFHELERLSVFASQTAQELSFKEILTESVLRRVI